jgi:hypothetical protein
VARNLNKRQTKLIPPPFRYRCPEPAYLSAASTSCEFVRANSLSFAFFLDNLCKRLTSSAKVRLMFSYLFSFLGILLTQSLHARGA